jgi:predicted phosphodiesterase
LRIALIADVHGNLLALEAVLADLRQFAPDATWNLGDHLSGPLWAAATADLLMATPMVHIRGNHDRQLLDRPVEQMGPSDRAAYAELNDAHKAWLTSLPAVATIDGVHLCHGTPADDATYLVERTDGAGLLTAPAIEKHLSDVPESIVVCGHSHIPRVVRSAERRTIINPGSVGLAAYNADDHNMECGSPHARYMIVDVVAGRAAVMQRGVEYGWDQAADLAASRGRPDWAVALRTGYALVDAATA